MSRRAEETACAWPERKTASSLEDAWRRAWSADVAAEGGRGPVSRGLGFEAREFEQCPESEGCCSGMAAACPLGRSLGQLGRRTRGEEAPAC